MSDESLTPPVAEAEPQDPTKESLLRLLPFIEALGDQVADGTFIVNSGIRLKHFAVGSSEYELQQHREGSGYADALHDVHRGDTLRIRRNSSEHLHLGWSAGQRKKEIEENFMTKLETDMSLLPWGEQTERPSPSDGLVSTTIGLGDSNVVLLATSDYWTLARQTETGLDSLSHEDIVKVLDLLSEAELTQDMAEAV